MLGKKEDTSKIDTIIGKGASVQGDIEVSKSIMIEGKVVGNIKAGGQVIMTRDAYVKGDVECDELVVDGTLEGKVIARSRAEIQKHGKVIGEIHCKLLVVEEGGFINGLTNMALDTAVKKHPENKK